MIICCHLTVMSYLLQVLYVFCVEIGCHCGTLERCVGRWNPCLSGVLLKQLDVFMEPGRSGSFGSVPYLRPHKYWCVVAVGGSLEPFSVRCLMEETCCFHGHRSGSLGSVGALQPCKYWCCAVYTLCTQHNVSAITVLNLDFLAVYCTARKSGFNSTSQYKMFPPTDVVFLVGYYQVLCVYIYRLRSPHEHAWNAPKVLFFLYFC